MKLTNPLAAYTCSTLIDNTENIQLNMNEDEKDNRLEKDIVFQKYYEINNTTDYQHSSCKIMQVL